MLPIRNLEVEIPYLKQAKPTIQRKKKRDHNAEKESRGYLIKTTFMMTQQTRPAFVLRVKRCSYKAQTLR